MTRGERQNRHLFGSQTQDAVIFGAMKRVLDDLPVVVASRLRVRGEIGRDTTSTVIRFDDGESGVEFVVGVMSQRLRRGGDWSMFLCGCCGRRCQKLRLFEGAPACQRCVRATGMRYRIEMVSHASKRAALTAAERIERLANWESITNPNRLRLSRRSNMEARLRRSLIVERQHALDEHEKRLKGK
jgi:hypothetical protein